MQTLDETAAIVQDLPLPTRLAEWRAATVVFPCIAAAVVAILALTDPLRGPTGTQSLYVTSNTVAAHATSIDHLCYDVSILAAIVIAVVVARLRNPKPIFLVIPVLGALAGLSLGIYSIENPGISATNNNWAGFGPSVLLLAAAIAPFFWRIVSWRELPRTIRFPISLAIAFVSVSDLIAMVRTLNQEAAPNNNIFILNEVLAPAAGIVPDSNSVPMYVHLYGFLLKPFAGLMSAKTLTNAAVLLLTVFSIAAVLLGILIVHRAFGRRSITIACGLVIPLACVTVFHNPLVVVSGAFQETPIRIFPGMLIGAFGLDQIARVRKNEVNRGVLLFLGLLCGLVAWNNHDFDIESAFIFGVVFLVATWGVERPWRSRGALLAGTLVGVGIYPLWAGLAGHPISWHYIFYFQVSFSQGQGHYPMVILGPVLFVMPLLIAATVGGWFMFFSRPGGPRPGAGRSDYAVLGVMFFGTWSMIAFLYYLNRSIAAGQLQVFLLPCGVTLACFVAAVLERGISFPLGRGSLRKGALLTALCAAPLTLAGSLAFASSLQFANPVRGVSIIDNPPPGTSFGWYDISFLATEREQVEARHETIGYFGVFTSWTALIPKLTALSVTDDPPDGGPMGPTSIDCEYLAAHQTNVMVVDSGTASTYGHEICGLYQQTKTTLDLGYVVYDHIGPLHLSSTS